MEELRDAIKQADVDKKNFHTSENFTVVKLPKQRSFRIEKLSPEEAVKCSLRESEMGYADRSYIRYFK